MMVHNIDNWQIGAHGTLEFKTGNGFVDTELADLNDLVELIIFELENQRHHIQEDSHDDFCEMCKVRSTYGCQVTNFKIDRRIKELRK